MNKIAVLLALFSILNSKIIAQNQPSNEEQIYTMVTDLPEFIGGTKLLGEFVNKSLIYPEIAKKNKIEGSVVIRFVVEKDGALSNFETLICQNPIFKDEALRIVRMLPKFKPGMQMGTLHRVYFTMPIQFKLDEKGNLVRQPYSN